MSDANVRRILKYHAGQARLLKAKVHPHAFRHGFAVHLVKQGVPMTVVADLLGHGSLETTKIYLKLTEREVRKMFDQCF